MTPVSQSNEHLISKIDGMIYAIPAAVVARHRANMIAAQQGYDASDKRWRKEYDSSLDDHDLLETWLKGLEGKELLKQLRYSGRRLIDNSFTEFAVPLPANPSESLPLKPIGTLYPTAINSVFSVCPAEDPLQSAFRYYLVSSFGDFKGMPVYDPMQTYCIELPFARKTENGFTVPGVRYEQVLIAVLDHVSKMKLLHPSSEYMHVIHHVSCALEQIEITRKLIATLPPEK